MRARIRIPNNFLLFIVSLSIVGSSGCQLTSQLPGMGWMDRMSSNPFRRSSIDAELPPPSAAAVPRNADPTDGIVDVDNSAERVSDLAKTTDSSTGYPSTGYPDYSNANAGYASTNPNGDSYSERIASADESLNRPQRGFYGQSYEKEATSTANTMDSPEFPLEEPSYSDVGASPRDLATPQYEDTAATAQYAAEDYSTDEYASPDYGSQDYGSQDYGAHDYTASQTDTRGNSASVPDYPSTDDYQARDYPRTDAAAKTFDNLPMTEDAPEYNAPSNYNDDTSSYGDYEPPQQRNDSRGSSIGQPDFDADYGGDYRVEPDSLPDAELQPEMPADSGGVQPPPRNSTPWRPGSTSDLSATRTTHRPITKVEPAGYVPRESITMSVGYSRPPILR